MTIHDIIWRDYQINCKKSIKENYDKGINKQLIVAATGVGKRLMSLNQIQHFNRTLFIAHREELIMQAYNDIEEYWPLQAGIIKGPRFEIDKKIVVASVQTLHNRLDKINPSTFDYVVVDEIHHYASPTFLKTLRHFEPKLLTGWTATPKRLDGLNLSNIVQEVIFEYSIENGIKDGFLSPIEAFQIKTSTDISKVERTAGDFNQKKLSEKVDSPTRNKLIVNKYLQYAKNRQAIGFCVDINHCYNLKREFDLFGVSCEVVVSDKERCPNREDIVKRFKQGKIDVLLNVTILTEGFDYEDVACVLMARPTQSETIYKQGIGRVTRLFSDDFIQRFNTNKGIILDFVDNTGKLSLINAWELEKDIPVEDRMFIPEEHREKLIKAKEEREANARKIAIQYGSDKKVNLLKLPEVKVWNSAKMLEMATESQIKWLKDIGVWQEDVEYTKAMASELISNQPARSRQVEFLRKHNYDVSGKVTLGQYQKVKWRVENENKYQIKK
jgi:superfamily II DNA or RNA helicase